MATPPVPPDAEARWRRLLETADAVRPVAPEPGGRGMARALAALTACATAAAALLLSGVRAGADATADSDLFRLTNQDRAANGVAALADNGTLAAIGESRPYGGCGFTVLGRSEDMIRRNYFSHPILGCGQLVFSMMSAAGIGYASAGENIGWDAGLSDPGASAGYINQAFMNSPEHRANILDRSYTALGVGSWTTAPGTSWTGAGTPYQNVWMFSEEFAQLGATAPPPPPPPPHRPPSTPAPAPSATLPPRNAPAPTPSLPPALSTAPPATPAPPSPSPPLPLPPPPGAPAPPLVYQGQGLLSDSVESVLESFFDD